MQQCNNATIRFLSVFLLLTALTFCSKKPIDAAQGPTPTPPEAAVPQDPIAQGNAYLDKLAVEISKVSDPLFFKTISDKAMEQKDGDSDFIYHLDKADPAIAAQFKAIEQAVGKDQLDNLPLLNIYVYAPYGQENADKAPQVYYWPFGKSESEVTELLGYRNGLKAAIDAKVEPPKDGGAIFVIGANERVSYEEKQPGRSAIRLEDGQKLLGSSDKYNFFLSGNYAQSNGIARNRGEAIYSIVYSRFANMAAKQKYEPWGMGDAEVRFYCGNSDLVKQDIPYLVSNTTVATGDIPGGYQRAGGFWMMERFTVDNYIPTKPFIPYISQYDDLTYITVVEEDRLLDWIQSILFILTNTTRQGIIDDFRRSGLEIFRQYPGAYNIPQDKTTQANEAIKNKLANVRSFLSRSVLGFKDTRIGTLQINSVGSEMHDLGDFRFQIGICQDCPR